MDFRDDIGNINLKGGGTDCPELSFTGMLKAFHAFPYFGSSMFVFTDASPKDATDANVAKLIQDAQDLDTKISFFTVSNIRCSIGGNIPPDYSKFEEVAAATGGKIFLNLY